MTELVLVASVAFALVSIGCACLAHAYWMWVEARRLPKRSAEIVPLHGKIS